MTVGNIRDPKVAEDILARGDADFIGMGRGLIADPEWVNKLNSATNVISVNVFHVTSVVQDTESVLNQSNPLYRKPSCQHR